MINKILKYSIIFFAYLSVLYPLGIRITTLSWTNYSILNNLFPLFGLTAVSILWLHTISGVFEPWLRKNFDFDRFVNITATIILICIILHPLLLLINYGFSLKKIFFYDTSGIWLGIIGFILLITYDIGKAAKKYNFFIKHWNSILIISTIGFLLIFPHSLILGSDLQSGALKNVWIFYGVTATMATIYTYGIKRFLD